MIVQVAARVIKTISNKGRSKNLRVSLLATSKGTRLACNLNKPP